MRREGGGESVYIVQWCDHEGNLQERRFERLEDARAEAEYLRELYGEEAVQVVPEK